MTTREKELIKIIKTQDIKTYRLAKDYSFIEWFDKDGKASRVLDCTEPVVKAVIDRWNECKE